MVPVEENGVKLGRALIRASKWSAHEGLGENIHPPLFAGVVTGGSSMKFLVLHGPNLNLFGRREPHIYGTTTLAEINERLHRLADERGVALETLQSNHEGVLVDKLHEGRYARRRAAQSCR